MNTTTPRQDRRADELAPVLNGAGLFGARFGTTVGYDGEYSTSYYRDTVVGETYLRVLWYPEDGERVTLIAFTVARPNRRRPQAPAEPGAEMWRAEYSGQVPASIITDAVRTAVEIATR